MIKVKKKKFENYRNNVIYNGTNVTNVNTNNNYNLVSGLKLRKPAENNFFGPTTSSYNTATAA